MSKISQRLRLALQEELPTVYFEDEIIDYLAGALEAETSATSPIPEEWSSHFRTAVSVDLEDDGIQELCRRLLQRITRTDVPELSHWLARDEVQFSRYEDAARRWCAESKCLRLEDLSSEETWQSFSKALGLKKLEDKRGRKELPAFLAKINSGSIFGTVSDPYRYELQEELGHGNFGRVYRCVQRQAGDAAVKEYAVKVIDLGRLKLQADQERAFAKLHRETDIMLKLRHTHVVSLLDMVRTKNNLCIVLELVKGGDLFDAISQEGGAFSEPKARYVFMQLVYALQYIHSKGVVHRDLKPENILVQKKESLNGFLEVKITDFGTSKLVDDGYEKAVTRCGTEEYWAPEVSDASQAAKGYDETVDLWSLGVVLFVMLEGSYPFITCGQLDKSAYSTGKCRFRNNSISKEARELIGSLIKVRPRDRLSLGKCLTHSWVTDTEGPVPEIVDQSLREVDTEESFNLQSEPADVKLLQKELRAFTTNFMFSAELRRQAAADGSEDAPAAKVVVTWERPSIAAAGKSNNKDLARNELLRILERHCPGQSFRSQRQEFRPAARGSKSNADGGVGGVGVKRGSRLATVKEDAPSTPPHAPSTPPHAPSTPPHAPSRSLS